MHAHMHIIPRYSENEGFNPSFVDNSKNVNLEEIHQLLTK